MIHVVRPTFAQARTSTRFTPPPNPDGRCPYWNRGSLDSDPVQDPSLLDQQFDEMGCEVSMLLRIANQP